MIINVVIIIYFLFLLLHFEYQWQVTVFNRSLFFRVAGGRLHEWKWRWLGDAQRNVSGTGWRSGSTVAGRRVTHRPPPSKGQRATHECERLPRTAAERHLGAALGSPVVRASATATTTTTTPPLSESVRQARHREREKGRAKEPGSLGFSVVFFFVFVFAVRWWEVCARWRRPSASGLCAASVRQYPLLP